jgi:hypothetical protein
MPKLNAEYFTPVTTILHDTDVYEHLNGVLWMYPEGGFTRYFRTEHEFRTYELTQSNTTQEVS